MSLDILDFPLYEWSEESELQQHESQFGLNIPNLTLDHVSHGKELEPHVTTSPQIHNEMKEEMEDDPVEYDTGNDIIPPEEEETDDHSHTPRWSTYPMIPSRKFLEMFQ